VAGSHGTADLARPYFDERVRSSVPATPAKPAEE
jgi:hypothetical protein